MIICIVVGDVLLLLNWCGDIDIINKVVLDNCILDILYLLYSSLHYLQHLTFIPTESNLTATRSVGKCLQILHIWVRYAYRQSIQLSYI